MSQKRYEESDTTCTRNKYEERFSDKQHDESMNVSRTIDKLQP